MIWTNIARQMFFLRFNTFIGTAQTDKVASENEVRGNDTPKYCY